MKKIWPEWCIDEPMGTGSYGTVYRAVRAGEPSCVCAIKIISIPRHPAELDSLRSEGMTEAETRTYLSELVNDFVGEIRMMEILRGAPNIVCADEYAVVEKEGEIGWDICIRMEYLTPFNVHICDKRLSEADVLKLGVDLCAALEACAQHGIIHRDIKPENILVGQDGTYKLGDFGIARKLEHLTFGLSQKGTVNYMAPEAVYSYDYDARADIYSLGLVLYRLLNKNRLPFLDTEKQLLLPRERQNATECRLRGDALPPPCEASPAVSEIILKACAYRPEDRYSTAAEMKQALLDTAEALYGGVPDGAALPAAAARNHKKGRNFRALKILTAALLATGLFLGGGLLWWHRANHDAGQPDDPPVQTPATAEKTVQPETTRVPQTAPAETDPILPVLDGLSVSEAEAALIRAGIGVETTAVFHETAEKDTVLAYAYDPDRHTVVLTVSLGPKIATGLEVERMPDETEYFRGDSFSPEGLVLTVLYGEHREPAEEDFTFTPGRFDAAGEQTVTVSCAGQTAEIPVVVHDVVCVGIEVCRLPLKTTYRVGDPLETAGMAVARVYNNGEREIAAEEMVCTPVVLTRPGEQQITVTCAGMKTFFDITVEEAN